jgi:hypothetical protein
MKSCTERALLEVDVFTEISHITYMHIVLLGFLCGGFFLICLAISIKIVSDVIIKLSAHDENPEKQITHEVIGDNDKKKTFLERRLEDVQEMRFGRNLMPPDPAKISETFKQQYTANPVRRALPIKGTTKPPVMPHALKSKKRA